MSVLVLPVLAGLAVGGLLCLLFRAVFVLACQRTKRQLETANAETELAKPKRAEPAPFDEAAEMIIHETELNGSLYARINDLEMTVACLTSLLMNERDDWAAALNETMKHLAVGSQRPNAEE